MTTWLYIIAVVALVALLALGIWQYRHKPHAPKQSTPNVEHKRTHGKGQDKK